MQQVTRRKQTVGRRSHPPAPSDSSESVGFEGTRATLTVVTVAIGLGAGFRVRFFSLGQRLPNEPVEDRVEGGTFSEGRIRVNEQIGVSPVRLIDDEGGQLGVVSLEAARERAQERGLDLVEVSPDSRPPVVRLMDALRFRPEGRRRAGEGQGQQAPVKEVRFRPGGESHEYEFKVRHIRRFIAEGYRVAVTTRPDGRTGTSSSTDAALMERLRADLEDVARAESCDPAAGPPTSMTLTPFTRE